MKKLMQEQYYSGEEIAPGRRFRARRMRGMQLARQDVAVPAARGLAPN
ncbi:hypothetical protein [Planococcus wigleyi]|uniref:Uncharacterized protein n=1 Tax=Planococcus wigleyi TaxID=2762216 RepID=A0ABR8W9B4_9BACL|nr:hypothetical protein [Planococcus wigleyi]MBD8013341.1 hypothetical protein [Planococcus wigleyi]